MKYIVTLIIAFVVIGMLAASPLYAYLTDEVVTCTVEEKERVNKQDSSKYLIFCEEQVLENTDSLWYWKWNSSDFYRDIKVGETYEVRVYGWRIPFLSMYQNIIEITKELEDNI